MLLYDQTEHRKADRTVGVNCFVLYKVQNS